MTPTTHGNLLVGPTAVDIEEKEGTNTTKTGLDEVAQKAMRSVPNLPLRQVITSFAGLRAHEDGHEFIIREVEDAEAFLTVLESNRRDLPVHRQSENWWQNL